MTEIEVDGSLVFRFSAAWATLRWDTPQRAAGRKKADLAATGPTAVLIEAKDDRIKDPASRLGRRNAVQSGDFIAEMALKFRHSAEDICAVEPTSSEASFCRSFHAVWEQGRRQCVLWWELPPEPPSGEGTRDDRWKAHLSALQNVLKGQLHDLRSRVRIANQRFHPEVVDGMDVADVAVGIAKRRGSQRRR